MPPVDKLSAFGVAGSMPLGGRVVELREQNKNHLAGAFVKQTFLSFPRKLQTCLPVNSTNRILQACSTQLCRLSKTLARLGPPRYLEAYCVTFEALPTAGSTTASLGGV